MAAYVAVSSTSCMIVTSSTVPQQRFNETDTVSVISTTVQIHQPESAQTWNSHSLLSRGHTWRVFNHREMQWKWNAWLQTPVQAYALFKTTYLFSPIGNFGWIDTSNASTSWGYVQQAKKLNGKLYWDITLSQRAGNRVHRITRQVLYLLGKQNESILLEQCVNAIFLQNTWVWEIFP